MHTVKSHWVANSFIVRPQKRRLCFVPHIWSYFSVVPDRSWFSWLASACSDLLQLIPGCSICYKWRLYKMFWLANLQKMNFMLDIVTKWGKCYYKMGSFLFYKTGQVVLQSRVGLQNGTIFITKWGGDIAKWGNHYKKEKFSIKKFWQLPVDIGHKLNVHKTFSLRPVSTGSVLEPQSTNVKLL